MSDLPDDPRLAELFGAVRQLAEATQRIAGSLANLEAMYAAQQTKHEEDRAELKERQKRWDTERTEREKQWDQEKMKLATDLSRFRAVTGRLEPVMMTGMAFLIVVALAALAIAQVILLSRR